MLRSCIRRRICTTKQDRDDKEYGYPTVEKSRMMKVGPGRGYTMRVQSRSRMCTATSRKVQTPESCPPVYDTVLGPTNILFHSVLRIVKKVERRRAFVDILFLFRVLLLN